MSLLKTKIALLLRHEPLLTLKCPNLTWPFQIPPSYLPRAVKRNSYFYFSQVNKKKIVILNYGYISLATPLKLNDHLMITWPEWAKLRLPLMIMQIQPLYVRRADWRRGGNLRVPQTTLKLQSSALRELHRWCDSFAVIDFSTVTKYLYLVTSHHGCLAGLL